MCRVRFSVSLFVVCVLSIALLGGRLAAAQATPGTANSCDIAPRTLSEIHALQADPLQSRPQISTDGVTSASDEEIAGITQTMTEFFECGNQGKYLAAYALVTDEFLKDPHLTLDLESSEATGQIDFIGVFYAQQYVDGRVGAIVVANDHTSPSPVESFYFMFEKVGDRWLIDDLPVDFAISVDGEPMDIYATSVVPGFATPAA